MTRSTFEKWETKKYQAYFSFESQLDGKYSERVQLPAKAKLGVLPPTIARPSTKELFLMIPMHMMNREIIPGR